MIRYFPLCVLFWAAISVSALAIEPAGTEGSRVTLGSSVPLKGHASFLGGNIACGMQAYFNHVNENGGINGRKIVSIVLDDDYNPPLMISNVKRLINNSHVFALIGLVGTPTTLTVIRMCQDSRTPLLFPFTGAHELRYPFKRYVINLRPGYWQECAAAVDYLVRHGKKRFAVFYQKDAYGLNGLDGVDRRLIRYDLQLVGEASYIRGMPEVSEQVRELKRCRPDAIVLVGTADVCAPFIREAVRQGMEDVWYFNLSFVGSNELAMRLKDCRAKVFITQVVPLPTDMSLPAVREYRGMLKRYFPGCRSNVVSFEGFLDAKLFVEAYRRAGENPDREDLINAIENMREYDLGIGEKVNFGPGDHQGLDNIYLTRIQDGKILPVTD